jgi:type IV secretion system protein VirB10
MDVVRSTDPGAVNWGGGEGPLPAYPGTGSYSSPSRPVPEDRRLSGTAFARDSAESNPIAGSAYDGGSGSAALAAIAATRGLSVSGTTNTGEDSLTNLLKPGVVSPAAAQTLPTQQFLLAKGAFIDCTLETAIDSTLPGMTTCITATDTFGVNGKVVLLERGSKLIGETRGEVQNGGARVFVLWTEARTPSGVVVPLDSPGTDELGRSGLPGEVNRHFWDRFGAAVLVSVIDGAVQAGAQSTNRGNGAVIYNPTTSQDALTDVLKGTINIAPTVTKRQGDRIQILVARDLDFRRVYELHIAAH